MSPAVIEREIKLAFASVGEARAAVLHAGARPFRPRRLQDDVLLDTADGHLRRRRCVLRVRTDGEECTITFKGPAEPGLMKVRQELETAVGDPGVFRSLLERLGYRPWFRYQKYREELVLGGVIVAIDETPVGTFVELEGGERGIHAAAAALGRMSADYIRDSYPTIFLRQRQARGMPAGDMLFNPS